MLLDIIEELQLQPRGMTFGYADAANDGLYFFFYFIQSIVFVVRRDLEEKKKGTKFSKF